MFKPTRQAMIDKITALDAEDAKQFLKDITSDDPMIKPKPGDEERKIKFLYKK